MKRSLLFLCALLVVWAISVLAQDADTTALQGPRFLKKQIITPESNIARVGLFHTNIEIVAVGEHTGYGLSVPQAKYRPEVGPPFVGVGNIETPASIACVYGLVTKVTGCDPAKVTAVPSARGSRNIAIVDPYDDPYALRDLATFSSQFGLPAPTASNFTIVYASAARPMVDPTGDSEIEEALDIEYAHAMAPKAHIYLVEAVDNSVANLMQAVSVAANLLAKNGGGEISMSWGSPEFAADSATDSP
jgi:kumamolisin